MEDPSGPTKRTASRARGASVSRLVWSCSLLAVAGSVVGCSSSIALPSPGNPRATDRQDLPGFDYTPPTTIMGPGGARYHCTFVQLPAVTTSPVQNQAAPPGMRFLAVEVRVTNREKGRSAPAVLGGLFLKTTPGDPREDYPDPSDPAYLPLTPAPPPGSSRPEIPAGATMTTDFYTLNPIAEPPPRIYAIATYNVEGRGLLGHTRL